MYKFEWQMKDAFMTQDECFKSISNTVDCLNGCCIDWILVNIELDIADNWYLLPTYRMSINGNVFTFWDKTNMLNTFDMYFNVSDADYELWKIKNRDWKYLLDCIKELQSINNKEDANT
jgi:hypothetical protein